MITLEKIQHELDKFKNTYNVIPIAILLGPNEYLHLKEEVRQNPSRDYYDAYSGGGMAVLTHINNFPVRIKSTPGLDFEIDSSDFLKLL